ncbi:hypothetical protein Daus18300_010447 [Diaporthe australafricana]|uniref:Uncharacterized protein n=1 Tax=Diaporthe australafricana TaxID=127596 RepID=A0ABR3WAL4_9PEZI
MDSLLDNMNNNPPNDPPNNDPPNNDPPNNDPPNNDPPNNNGFNKENWTQGYAFYIDTDVYDYSSLGTTMWNWAIRATGPETRERRRADDLRKQLKSVHNVLSLCAWAAANSAELFEQGEAHMVRRVILTANMLLQKVNIVLHGHGHFMSDARRPDGTIATEGYTGFVRALLRIDKRLPVILREMQAFEDAFVRDCWPAVWKAQRQHAWGDHSSPSNTYY